MAVTIFFLGGVCMCLRHARLLPCRRVASRTETQWVTRQASPVRHSRPVACTGVPRQKGHRHRDHTFLNTFLSNWKSQHTVTHRTEAVRGRSFRSAISPNHEPSFSVACRRSWPSSPLISTSTIPRTKKNIQSPTCGPRAASVEVNGPVGKLGGGGADVGSGSKSEGCS